MEVYYGKRSAGMKRWRKIHKSVRTVTSTFGGKICPLVTAMLLLSKFLTRTLQFYSMNIQGNFDFMLSVAILSVGGWKL